MAGKYRFRLLALLFCTVSVLLPTARAENNCPWLNEATASGYLGGNAVGKFVPAQSSASSCTFVENESGGERNLVITVEAAPNAHERLSAIAQRCGGVGHPVKAIGNEAWQCTSDGHKRTQSDRIIGRVRDQVFSVTISTNVARDPVLTPEELDMRIDSAAEEVSGNLF